MSSKRFYNELAKAVDRPDAEELLRILEVYRNWDSKSEDYPDECDIVMTSPFKDPEKAVAFVMLASASYDDEDFLTLISAGILEDLLRNPSEQMLDRIVNESRRAPRLRWMLSIVYSHAIESTQAKLAVKKVVGDVNCNTDPLPPRPY